MSGRKNIFHVTLVLLILLGATSPVSAIPFIRGDANVDGVVDVSDPVFHLECLFRGQACPSCEDAADSNDDGEWDVSDPVYTLLWLFRSAAEPPAPGPVSCGEDPTVDALECAEFDPCVQPEATAFRISEMYLRDPHVFVVPLVGCRDVTDTGIFGNNSVNEELNNSISALETNFVLRFLPLDQAGMQGNMEIVEADCAETIGTSCDLNPLGIRVRTTYFNVTEGTCLQPLAETTSAYSPAVESSAAPPQCWVSWEFNLPILLFGVSIPLIDTRIAAGYVGDPATRMTGGLIRGFLTESDANASLLPASLPVFGGAPISSVLPGGDGNCVADDPGAICPAPPPGDMDCHRGERGWWFYLEFTADQVTYTGP